ncbi:unnamed protein product [Brassica rapa subsp. narinosa]
MKKVFLNIVLLSFLLGVAFPMKKKLASQLRNTKTSTQKMKKMFLNFVILSFLLGVAFNLANGADVNHQGQCDSDLECYTMRSCQRGPGYCDQKDGKCKCPKLQVVDTNGADVNHQGQCDSDLECYTMRSCQRGPGYCDQKDGKCKCPK